MLQRMSPFLALFGPCAMSDLSPECAPKRTFANASCRQRPVHHLRSHSPSHGLSLDYQGDIITRTNVDMHRNLEMLKKRALVRYSDCVQQRQARDPGDREGRARRTRVPGSIRRLARAIVDLTIVPACADFGKGEGTGLDVRDSRITNPRHASE